MARLIEFLKALTEAKFYGEITIRFEAGHILLVEKNEKIKY